MSDAKKHVPNWHREGVRCSCGFECLSGGDWFKHAQEAAQKAQEGQE